MHRQKRGSPNNSETRKNSTLGKWHHKIQQNHLKQRIQSQWREKMNHWALNLQRFATDITEDVNIKVIIEYVLCQLLAIGLENTALTNPDTVQRTLPDLV